MRSGTRTSEGRAGIKVGVVGVFYDVIKITSGRHY